MAGAVPGAHLAALPAASSGPARAPRWRSSAPTTAWPASRRDSLRVNDERVLGLTGAQYLCLVLVPAERRGSGSGSASVLAQDIEDGMPVGSRAAPESPTTAVEDVGSTRHDRCEVAPLSATQRGALCGGSGRRTVRLMDEASEGGRAPAAAGALLSPLRLPDVPAPLGGGHDLAARRLGRPPRADRARARAHRVAGLGGRRHGRVAGRLRRDRPGARHARRPLRARHGDARRRRRPRRRSSRAMLLHAPGRRAARARVPRRAGHAAVRGGPLGRAARPRARAPLRRRARRCRASRCSRRSCVGYALGGVLLVRRRSPRRRWPSTR